MSPSDAPRRDVPSANAPFPFPTAERHDAPPQTSADLLIEPPSEDAIDHGIDETFPASDPVSVSVTKAVPKEGEIARPRDQAEPDRTR